MNRQTDILMNEESETIEGVVQSQEEKEYFHFYK